MRLVWWDTQDSGMNQNQSDVISDNADQMNLRIVGGYTVSFQTIGYDWVETRKD